MTITAVYPGTCPCCGRAIPPSQQIHWHRGRSSRHPTCTQPPKSPYTPELEQELRQIAAALRD